ncbi:hypothetical protein BC628DRAFT_802729 [Trametes gibbosa]|nr:hypothetical protein BC628DRAFT_802729 [Trametes gibbosa]
MTSLATILTKQHHLRPVLWPPLVLDGAPLARAASDARDARTTLPSSWRSLLVQAGGLAGWTRRASSNGLLQIRSCCTHTDRAPRITSGPESHRWSWLSGYAFDGNSGPTEGAEHSAAACRPGAYFAGCTFSAQEPVRTMALGRERLSSGSCGRLRDASDGSRVVALDTVLRCTGAHYAVTERYVGVRMGAASRVSADRTNSRFGLRPAVLPSRACADPGVQYRRQSAVATRVLRMTCASDASDALCAASCDTFACVYTCVSRFSSTIGGICVEDGGDLATGDHRERLRMRPRRYLRTLSNRDACTPV